MDGFDGFLKKPGAKVEVKKRVFKGKVGLNIREFFVGRDGDWVPGRAGIWIPEDRIAIFLRCVIAQAGSKVEALGSRAKGTNPRAKGTNPRAKGTNPRALSSTPVDCIAAGGAVE